MAQQGFKYLNGNLYVSQELDSGVSVAEGLDFATDLMKIKVQLTKGATPTGTAQITISPTANGNITFTPNGAGKIIGSYLTAGVVLSSATGELTSSSGLSGQVLTSNGASAPTFQSTSSVVWTAVAGNTAALVANNGYMLNNAGLTTATLPVTCAAGATIRIMGSGTGLFLIAQNAGQSIKLGNAPGSTPGVMGSLASMTQFDAVELLCVVADTVFATASSVGNFTVS